VTEKPRNAVNNPLQISHLLTLGLRRMKEPWEGKEVVLILNAVLVIIKTYPLIAFLSCISQKISYTGNSTN
jgi:hypothetical protein